MSPSLLENEGHESTTNGPNLHVPTRLYRIDMPPSLAQFQKLYTQVGRQSNYYPLSDSMVKNIPIYDVAKFLLSDSKSTSSLQDEWHHILLSGPGVLVLKNFVTDSALLEQVNNVFDEIISTEGQSSKGDHFAAAGKNSRIWNSFQKHALHDPDSFVEYYSNPWLALACEAWLGPGYQVTAQVNIVKPGGSPQAAHRDYHLGFQSAEQCAQFPKSMQIASQQLTLQGAVAHSDMPLASGPTRFLPFSQLFDEGYMAYRLPEFQAYFDAHWVSLPLQRGDAVFFNPALFHAAGENQSSANRSANLLQVSSAFGKPMETIDSRAVLQRCWPALKQLHSQPGREREVDACVRAIASGYPFPTNLDRRPPAPGGMAPSSEADVVREALKLDWETDQVVDAVRQLQLDSLA